jgi:hypothetical protein
VNALVVLALLSTAFPVQEVRGALDLADRTEVRGGNFGFSTDPAVHLETIPSARLTVAGRTSDFTLMYEPRMGFTDLERGIDPYYLNNGSANYTARWRTFRFMIDEAAAYGTLNLSTPLLPATGTLPSNVLLQNKVLYEATLSTFTMVYAVRRWLWRTLLSYSLSGGADYKSRVNGLPLISTPRAETAVEYDLARRTHLVTTAIAYHDQVTTPDQDFTVLEANEGLTHRLSRGTELLLAGGGAWVYGLVSIPPLVERNSSGITVTVNSAASPAPYVPGAKRTSRTLYPTATAALSMHLPERDHVDARLQARLAPTVNRTTGQLSQQISGFATVLGIDHPWQLQLDASVAQSIDEGGINYLTYLSGQASIGYEATRHVLFQLGTQLGWQKVGVSATPTAVELAFVAVTLRPATLRF